MEEKELGIKEAKEKVKDKTKALEKADKDLKKVIDKIKSLDAKLTNISKTMQRIAPSTEQDKLLEKFNAVQILLYSAQEEKEGTKGKEKEGTKGKKETQENAEQGLIGAKNALKRLERELAKAKEAKKAREQEKKGLSGANAGPVKAKTRDAA